MRLLLLLVPILLFSVSAEAQPGVTLVEVPVIVRDHEGHAVGKLDKTGFQLFDNGKRVEIASFTECQSTPGRLPPGGMETDAPRRLIAYLVDDLSMWEDGDLAGVSAAVARLTSGLEPGERAAILTTSRNVFLDFTNDPSKLRDALARLVSHPLFRASRNIAAPQAEVLDGLVRQMPGLPARREVILISTGFAGSYDRSQGESDLIDAAIRSDVAIHTVDIVESSETRYQGAGSGHEGNSAMLAALAHGTGGVYMMAGDFAASFRKLATPDGHYVLGFLPTARADGRFHQLKVKLQNERKLTVEAREGYYSSRPK